MQPFWYYALVQCFLGYVNFLERDSKLLEEHRTSPGSHVVQFRFRGLFSSFSLAAETRHNLFLLLGLHVGVSPAHNQHLLLFGEEARQLLHVYADDVSRELF